MHKLTESERIVRRLWWGRMLRRIIWSSIILLLLCAALAFTLYTAASNTPAWYTPTDPSGTQQADTMVDKMFEVQNWASSHHAFDTVRAAGRRPLNEKEPENELTVSFTQDELNSFLTRWYDRYANQRVKDQRLSEVFRRPMLRIESNGITIAGTVPPLGDRIVSLDIDPIIEQGQLNLRIKTIRSGNLPLPDFTWSKPREMLIASLWNLMTQLRPTAALDSAGAANEHAVSVVLAQQGLDTLRHLPTDNIFFLPIVAENSLPVRLKSLELQSASITLTTEPLTAAQRQSLIKQIRTP